MAWSACRLQIKSSPKNCRRESLMSSKLLIASCDLNCSNWSGWYVGGFRNFKIVGCSEGRFWVLVGCMVGIGFWVLISHGIYGIPRDVLFFKMVDANVHSFESLWSLAIKKLPPYTFKRFILSKFEHSTGCMSFIVSNTTCYTALIRHDDSTKPNQTREWRQQW